MIDPKRLDDIATGKAVPTADEVEGMASELGYLRYRMRQPLELRARLMTAFGSAIEALAYLERLVAEAKAIEATAPDAIEDEG